MGSLGGRHSYEDQREDPQQFVAKDFRPEGVRRDSSWETSRIRPTREQTDSQTTVVASHSIRAEAALEPYSQSQTTVVELHFGRASAASGNFITAS